MSKTIDNIIECFNKNGMLAEVKENSRKSKNITIQAGHLSSSFSLYSSTPISFVDKLRSHFAKEVITVTYPNGVGPQQFRVKENKFDPSATDAERFQQISEAKEIAGSILHNIIKTHEPTYNAETAPQLA